MKKLKYKNIELRNNKLFNLKFKIKLKKKMNK